ncbi:site-2 protease family protein [Cellulomonas endophytica]|uniref:site-2 protease family protein n=1 Tax=Cellulomonas endophytica TaxID=2494735 RepID=UPI001F0BC4DC|nr:site-2 protease family protein [Cellulomonas endophytica]
MPVPPAVPPVPPVVPPRPPLPERPAPTGTKGWRVGRVAGAPVVVAPSSLVAAVVLAFAFLPVVQQVPDLRVAAYLVALAVVVLLFASVLVHELAHGLVARARGQQPQEFVLTLWGGHTSFSGESSTPGTSALVAAAGPAANLVLAGLGALAAGVLDLEGSAGLLVTGLAAANLLVALFNLLPGLPLDGGRVLEAAVWAARRDRHLGTRVAGRAGLVLAVGVPVAVLGEALAQGRPPSFLSVAWSGLLGAYLFTSARAALAGERWARARDGLRLEQVLRTAVAVPAGSSVTAVVAAARAAAAEEVVVLGEDGGPASTVVREAASGVPPEAAPATPVGAVSAPLPPEAVVDARLAGPHLLAALAAACRRSPLAVAVLDGRVVGVVRAADVVALLRGR